MSTSSARLTAAEISAIQAALSHYPERSAASIEALKLIQKHHGWVSDDALSALAELLQCSPEDLDSIATFYNLIFRKPVGRTVIYCCDSVSCWMLGGDDVRERLCARLGIGLGETTPDGAYTLLPSVCLGACDHAPVLMVGERLCQDVTPDSVDALLGDSGSGVPDPGGVP